MALDALVKPLLSLPLFRGLTPLQLTEIARCAERIVYRPGDVIVAENHASDAAVIVVSGESIRLDDMAKRPRGELLAEGSMIAELAMLVEIVHSTTVVAQTQVKALRLTREKMHDLMRADPSLAQHFSSLILGRLTDLAHELRAVDQLLVGSIGPWMPAKKSSSTALHPTH